MEESWAVNVIPGKKSTSSDSKSYSHTLKSPGLADGDHLGIGTSVPLRTKHISTLEAMESMDREIGTVKDENIELRKRINQLEVLVNGQSDPKVMDLQGRLTGAERLVTSYLDQLKSLKVSKTSQIADLHRHIIVMKDEMAHLKQIHEEALSAKDDSIRLLQAEVIKLNEHASILTGDLKDMRKVHKAAIRDEAEAKKSLEFSMQTINTLKLKLQKQGQNPKEKKKRPSKSVAKTLDDAAELRNMRSELKIATTRNQDLEQEVVELKLTARKLRKQLKETRQMVDNGARRVEEKREESAESQYIQFELHKLREENKFLAEEVTQERDRALEMITRLKGWQIQFGSENGKRDSPFFDKFIEMKRENKKLKALCKRLQIVRAGHGILETNNAL